MNLLRMTGLAIKMILLIFFCAAVVFADEYRIGSEDVLSISFWQKPLLNQTGIVRQDGKITLSVIGEITAAGLTPSELATKIGDQISRYDKDVSQATVEVVAYNSQKVFITGQVRNPGRFAFEVIPNVWDLIKEAGGVTDLGDLSNVVIIRGSKNKGEILNVNLAEEIAQADPSKLPRLYPGDIVEVKRTSSEAGPGLPTKMTEERKNIIYVIGRVGRPGSINYEDRLEVLDAISLAGGPLPDADLKHVKIFNKRDTYSNVMTLDLDKRSKKGTPPNYTLKPSDTIYLPAGQGGFWGTWARVRDFVAIFGSIVSTYLLVDRFTH